MLKKQLVDKTVNLLRDCDARKRIPTHRTVLHISDDHGNNKDFVVTRQERGLLFTQTDVTMVIDAFLESIIDALKQGEEVMIHGFGTFSVNRREASRVRRPDTKEIVDVEAHYVPKFLCGKRLRMAARVYETGLNNKVGD